MEYVEVVSSSTLSHSNWQSTSGYVVVSAFSQIQKNFTRLGDFFSGGSGRIYPLMIVASKPRRRSCLKEHQTNITSITASLNSLATIDLNQLNHRPIQHPTVSSSANRPRWLPCTTPATSPRNLASHSHSKHHSHTQHRGSMVSTRKRALHILVSTVLTSIHQIHRQRRINTRHQRFRLHNPRRRHAIDFWLQHQHSIRTKALQNRW